MKKSTSQLTLMLMMSSIALLLILQAFWLTNSYERAYFDLRRETTMLFRTTVLTLRDSSVARQFVEVKDDTSNIQRQIFLSRQYRSTSPSSDSTNQTQGTQQIKIFLTEKGNSDSLNHILRPLASRIRRGNFGSGENFIFTMRDDSVSVDSIRLHFRNALSDANIDFPFVVKYSSFVPTPTNFHQRKRLFRGSEVREPVAETNVFSNFLPSEWIPIDPIRRYGVIMSDFRPILIKNIFPQILFSLFLTFVTATAFIILYKSLRSQQRLILMKNDFISNITHELKTPIATVSVALEALKNFNGIDNPVRTREYLDIAQHELDRLSVLTDKVLNTSLFDERGVKLDLEKVDLEKLIDEILNSMTLLSEKNQARIEFKKTGSDFIVDGSIVHLANVIYNLLDNSIKYSPVKPAINVQLNDNGDSISLSVTDNGLGIPKEFHDNIFEKFFRMPTGDVHTVKGYGLGLSYVESVVKAHHGKISLASETGKGSTFKIVLPRVTTRA